MVRFIIFTVLILLPAFLFSQTEARLLRFPAIYENQIVFTYAGDLYTVSAQGGVARKITNHDGYEMFARFSPDGQQLAFTAQYDGNTEVYLMPSQGGVPKRLTYTATLGRDDVSDRMGPNNIVMTWKHDNKTIVFRSRMISFNSFNGSLFMVDTDGYLPVQIPVPRDFVLFHRMIKKWPITVYSGSSGHGNDIAAVWQMTSGYMILIPNK